jgi:hypothetical protein
VKDDNHSLAVGFIHSLFAGTITAMSNPSPPRRPFIERTSTALLFLVVIFSIGIGVGVLLGKLRPPIQVAATTQVILKPSTDPTRFGVGDKIEIVLTDIAGPGVKSSKVCTIDEKGTVALPLIGAIEVRDRSAVQIQQVIARAYRDANIVSNMQVEIKRVSSPTTAPVAKP